MAGVLEGVRVLDMGRYIAGPMCSALLGDHGAEVIRIERVGGGEDRTQYPTSADSGGNFLAYNRNKLGITLNPYSLEAGAKGDAAAWIESADVLVVKPCPRCPRWSAWVSTTTASRPSSLTSSWSTPRPTATTAPMPSGSASTALARR